MKQKYFDCHFHIIDKKFPVVANQGFMQWYSRTASGTGEPESGVWSASNGTLNLNFATGDRLAFVYVLEGATMFCPREGRYRLWTRIN